jgi:hypothetical protein
MRSDPEYSINLRYVSAHLPWWQTLPGTVMVEAGQRVVQALDQRGIPPLVQRVQEPFLRTPHEKAGAEFAEDRKIKAWITAFQTGLNLAKPKNAARETLSDNLHGVSTRPQRTLCPFDHALCLRFTALAVELSPVVSSKGRSNLFLRTFLPSSAPFDAFRRARRPSFLAIIAPERPYFAGKSPLARLGPLCMRAFDSGGTLLRYHLPCGTLLPWNPPSSHLTSINSAWSCRVLARWSGAGFSSAGVGKTADWMP